MFDTTPTPPTPSWQARIERVETREPVSDPAEVAKALKDLRMAPVFEEIDAEYGIWLLGLPYEVDRTLWFAMTVGNGAEVRLSTGLVEIHIEVEGV